MHMHHNSDHNWLSWFASKLSIFGRHRSDSYTPISSIRRKSLATGKFRPTGKIIGAVLLMACSAGLALAGVFTLMDARNTGRLDETLCQKGEMPETHLAMIVDLTDGLTPNQQQALKEELALQYSRLKVNEQFSLYAIARSASDKTGRLETLFSKCRPRDGSKASFLTEHPGRISKRFKAQFAEPLERAVGEMDMDHTASTSPILESLRSVALDDRFSAASRREIVLFSNMMQRNGHIDQYESGWENFKALAGRSLRVLDVQNLLVGAKVTVFLLSERKFTDNHLAWWQQYFRYSGAETLEIKRI